MEYFSGFEWFLQEEQYYRKWNENVICALEKIQIQEVVTSKESSSEAASSNSNAEIVLIEKTCKIGISKMNSFRIFISFLFFRNIYRDNDFFSSAKDTSPTSYIHNHASIVYKERKLDTHGWQAFEFNTISSKD